MSGELILVIDDSQQIVKHLTERLLPTFGFESISASNGRLGLELVKTKQPDLVIIDLNLPEMTGLDILHKLVEDSIFIPTILMTGYGSEKSAIEAFRLGIKDYLIKPFTGDEVLSAIDRALAEKRHYANHQDFSHELQVTTISAQQQLFELKNIVELSKKIITLNSIEKIKIYIAQKTIELTDAEESIVWLCDKETNNLDTFAKLKKSAFDTITPLSQPQEPFKFTQDHPLLNQIITNKIPIRKSVFSEGGIEIKPNYTVRAILCTPMLLEGKVIGIIGAINRIPPRAFSEKNESLLSTFADFCAIAIHNAELQNNVTTISPNTSQSDLFLKRLNKIFSANTLDEMIKHTLQEINNEWDVEGCSIWLVNETRKYLKILMSVGVSTKLLTPLEIPIGQGIVGHVVKTKKSVIARQAKDHPNHLKDVDKVTGFNTRSILCVPLIYGENTIGALQLLNKKSGFFNEKDLIRAKELGTILALALPNSLLIRQVEKYKQRFETLFTLSEEMILVINHDQSISHINIPAQKQLGLSSTSLGKTVEETLPAFLLPFFQKYFQQNETTEQILTLDDGSKWLARGKSLPRLGQHLFLFHELNSPPIKYDTPQFSQSISHEN